MSSQDSPFKESLFSRRRKKRSQILSHDLQIHATPNKYHSFKVSDTSYTRQDVHIDEQGITRTPSINTVNGSNESKEDIRSPSRRKSFIKHIDEIRYLDVLGNGQCGLVRLGIHLPTKTFMAVKQISIYEKSRRHQIMNELNALYETNKSRGLVQFYDVFYKRGSVYLMLEYCDCGSLEDVMKKVSNIPEEALGKICIHVLDGLITLHKQRKQVHRDIKPSNVCLCSDGQAKMADFGISADLNSSLSKCRTVVGTVTYMSPERIRGEEYAFKSDIWALGLVLMECATGKFPYPSTTIYLELYQHIAQDDPPRLPVKGKFSKEFASFLEHCLQKDSSKRPDAKQLRNHPWIRKSEKSKFDLKRWIKENKLALPLPDISKVEEMEPNEFDDFNLDA